MSEPVVVSQDFAWIGKQQSDIVRAVELYSQLLDQPDSPQGVVVEGESPRIEKRWTGLNELAATLSNAAASVEVRDRDYSRTLDFDIADERLRVRLTLSEDELPQARTVILSIQKELNLVDGRDRQESTKEVEYRLPSSEARWAIEAADKVAALIPSAPRFDGGFELSSNGRERTTSTDLNNWKREIASHWDEIIRFDVRVSNRRHTRSISLNGDRRNLEIRIRIEARSSDEVAELLAEVAARLGLDQSISRVGLTGEQRTYFANRPIDQIWFKRTIESLQELGWENEAFTGRYSLLPDAGHSSQNRQYIVNSMPMWRERILRDWNRVADFTANYWVSFLELRLFCDAHRDLVEIEVRTHSDDESGNVLARLEQDLDLLLAPSVPWNFITVGRYRIKGWTTDRFIKALKDALGDYVGPKYKLFEAYAIEGKETRTRNDFPTVDSLVDQLKSKSYWGLSVYVEGPSGNGLGVHVREDLNTLEIRSTLDQKDFSKLREKFSALRLTQGKEESAGISEGKRAFLDTLFGKAVAAIGVVVLALVSWEGIWSAIPDYTVIVTQPTSFGSEVEKLAHGTVVRVEWVVQCEQFSQRSRFDPGPATVTVYKAGGEVERRLEGVSSGVDIPTLPPGRYTISVDVPVGTPPEHIKIEILPPTPANQSS